MDQVVCINDDWPKENLSGDLLPIKHPVKNGIYTTTEVITWIGGIRAFVLAEIPPMDNGLDYLWGVTHFRPVKKTDIGDFTEMLKPIDKVKKQEKEKA